MNDRRLPFLFFMTETRLLSADEPVVVHSDVASPGYHTEDRRIPPGEASRMKVGMSWSLAKTCGLVTDDMKDIICDGNDVITYEGLAAWETLREYRLTADDVAPPMTDEDRAGLDARNEGRPWAA